MSDSRLLAEWFPEFAEQLDKLDEIYKEILIRRFFALYSRIFLVSMGTT